MKKLHVGFKKLLNWKLIFNVSKLSPVKLELVLIDSLGLPSLLPKF